MWVRVPEWVLVEGGRARPTAGSLLAAVAVRAHGQVATADSTRPDGITAAADPDGSDSSRRVYVLTGVASHPRDVRANTKRHGRGQQSAAEFVLTVGPERLQVQCTQTIASEVRPGSRVTVTGELSLAGDYEWDAFELPDTRGDWLVVQAIHLPGGDLQVDLRCPPDR